MQDRKNKYIRRNIQENPIEILKFRMPGVRSLRFPLVIPKTRTPFSSTLILIYGFIALIILGTVLLALPISSSTGEYTSPLKALFTATSAVCVTGLVVLDTGTYWSGFGQTVLLILFQIGGLGYISGATLLLFAIGGRLGLREKLVITDSMGTEHLGGLLGIVVRVAIFSFIVECAGMLVFYSRFSGVYDPLTALWTSTFHAVSAFNNCGMDIFGYFTSLTSYSGDIVVMLTTGVMILFGSTGYIVIADIIRSRSLIRISLESKIVLTATAVLVILGMILYMTSEYTNPATLYNLSLPQKLAVSFFQAITSRAGGFTACDIGSLRQITLYCTMVLMFIGGASGSAAGGLKINTISVLAVTAWNIIRGNDNVDIFGRQLTRQIIYRAITLFFAYLLVVGIMILVLSITEDFPIESIFFETFSAMGTVGLSNGITPYLSTAGQILIIITMFTGRLGPLTLMAYMVRHRQPKEIDYPRENIRIG